jgi:hypothetical protein
MIKTSTTMKTTVWTARVGWSVPPAQPTAPTALPAGQTALSIHRRLASGARQEKCRLRTTLACFNAQTALLAFTRATQAGYFAFRASPENFNLAQGMNRATIALCKPSPTNQS